jgi:hypothetical protein
MPRGVPLKGFRATRNSKMMDAAVARFQPQVVVSNETDQEIDLKLRDRFSVLADLADAAIGGGIRAMIVSGPAGLGKSFTVEQALASSDAPYCIVKGFVRATGLYKKLWQYRHPGNVLVFDDADSIFFDDVSLNLLKAACDSTDTRRVSYLAETQMEDEDGGTIPRSFAFDGTVIFITNFDMDEAIERGHRLEEHFKALVSRAHYIDMAMKTRRDYVIRIKQVVGDGMLKVQGYSAIEEADIMSFIDRHEADLRELSLRMVIKVASLRRSNPAKFEKMAKVTCCKASR